MITTISLVTIRHYTKISYYYSSHCTFHSHNLFCNWKFVSLTLPHLLHSSSPTLPSGNHLFFVSMTLFMLCYASSGFPGGSDGKESACNERDLGSIPGLRRSPRGGHGYPFQSSCLENPHGQRSLAGYSPWGQEELDMTEQISTHTHTHTHACSLVLFYR